MVSIIGGAAGLSRVLPMYLIKERGSLWKNNTIIFSVRKQEMKMSKSENWILCPVCGNKTRLQIRADTELKNFPLYCPKRRQESLIHAKGLQVTVIKRFEAKMQNWLTKWQIKFYKNNTGKTYKEAIAAYYQILEDILAGLLVTVTRGEARLKDSTFLVLSFCVFPHPCALGLSLV